MLFSPQMAQLLARPPKRRPQAPTAPRARRELLRGSRFPRRIRRAAAAGRLLTRPPRQRRAQSR